MKGRKLSAEEMAVRRQEMLQAAFHLFAERNIDAVTLDDIAAKTGYTKRSLLRYFKSKDGLVIETATWAWAQFLSANRKRRPKEGGTAAEGYAFFLDSFLTLYHEHADLLRFNQYFNVYVKSRRVTAAQMQSYRDVGGDMRAWLHDVYQKGQADGTLRADATEAGLFNTTLHLMLAAVTRYAVGLVYTEGADAERELLLQKRMLLREFTTNA